MMRKGKILLVLSILLFTFLIVFPMTDSHSKDKPLVLKAGGISPPTADVSIASTKFAKLVGEKTGGKVKVEFYPAQQLGNAPTQLEHLTAGVQDFMCVSFAEASRLVKDFAITQLPYAFRDYEHLKKFMDGPTGGEIRQKLLKKWNIRVISYNWWRLPRVIFGKKPIFKLKDMEGLKFRMAGLPMYKMYIPAWGAVPTRVAWGEYYLALKQGLVDMGESCAENIYNMKFYEAAPYITVLNFAYDFSWVAMNEKRFQSLSPEIQRAIVKAANEGGDYFSGKVSVQFEKDKKKMMEEGTAFIYVSTKSWEAKTPEIATACEKEGFWSKGLYEKVQQIR